MCIMTEFFNVTSVQEALNLILQKLIPNNQTELVKTIDSLGRITQNKTYSLEDLPIFTRSSMDGYSVIAKDTYGASESIPAYLDIVSEIPMGNTQPTSITSGQASKVYTGGMIAKKSDAVILLEHTQIVSKNTIEVLRPVAPNENLIHIGEDVQKDDLILNSKHQIHPQDIGGLLSVGINKIEVKKLPRVSVISTGDELIPATNRPKQGQTRDINTHTINSLIKLAGGNPIQHELIKDDFDSQLNISSKMLESTDILIFSAGSSVSSRDLTAKVINKLGKPGVIIHGIALKPGKPTIVGLVNDKPIFGLPGNPVSAITVFNLLVKPVIEVLSGNNKPKKPKILKAKLTQNIPSVSGREDYVQVKLFYKNSNLYAKPIFGKSNLVHTMVNADGNVRIELDQDGLYSDNIVNVETYDY